MASTLQSILQDIGSIVDQDTTLPTGTDLTVRVNLIDQALREWAEAYEWKQLRVVGFGASVVQGTTSTALPTNFKKLMSTPIDLSTDFSYVEIRPENRFVLAEDAKYCYTDGNDITGQYIVFNPALSANASIVFDYQAEPTSMATLSDVLVCPSRNYITMRSIAKIYQSRSDPRFPQFNSEAQNALTQMIQEEAAVSAAMLNQTPLQTTKTGFRIGK